MPADFITILFTVTSYAEDWPQWLGTQRDGELTPKGHEEIGRAKIRSHGRDFVWSHPAFANRCVFVRNDKESRCFSLAK